jgi:hypothetical protein
MPRFNVKVACIKHEFYTVEAASEQEALDNWAIDGNLYDYDEDECQAISATLDSEKKP